MAFSHTPVMLQQCLQALDVKPDGVYLDGTAGGAGHSAAIAQQLQTGHLYALDQDPDAVQAATERLRGLPATVVQANFSEVKQVLKAQGAAKLSGALLDLGVSSHQLDEAERGFSYRNDAPLDMRMSQSGPTAADIVNTYSREELADILRNYGEEPYAWQIAGRIVAQRANEPITTTGQLAELVASAVPPAVRRKNKNPARRSFQALRIATNSELDVLTEGLQAIFEQLQPGGRLAVITFHSLEDRIVKQYFKKLTVACTCPPDGPICVCGGKATGRLVGKSPQVATKQEQEQNRRSRSAKLRVIEKIAESEQESNKN